MPTEDRPIRRLYRNLDDEREAAIGILLFMQKHEIEDEEMREIICMIDTVMQDEMFWEDLLYCGMELIRRKANGD